MLSSGSQRRRPRAAEPRKSSRRRRALLRHPVQRSVVQNNVTDRICAVAVLAGEAVAPRDRPVTTECAGRDREHGALIGFSAVARHPVEQVRGGIVGGTGAKLPAQAESNARTSRPDRRRHIVSTTSPRSNRSLGQEILMQPRRACVARAIGCFTYRVRSRCLR